MAKQTQVVIDAMTLLYEQGYARTSELDGYKRGEYSAKTASRVFAELKEAGLLTRESERHHTWYATDKLAEFKTASEVMAGDDR